MALKVAVQMDPIASINPAGDSTFAMMLEAPARGHSLGYYTVGALGLRGKVLRADVAPVAGFGKPKGEPVPLGEASRQYLGDYGVVLMRQDPPFDMAYITYTHLLERIHPRTFVMNPPFTVRNAPEKILVTEFPELMPPTLITRDRALIQEFRREHGSIIVKPLYGNGGAGVFLIEETSSNLVSLIELFEQAFREPFMVQRYLPEVRRGDKRIILVDGEPVGAVNRVPSEGEARSNMHVGG